MTTQHDFEQVRANGHEIDGAGFGRNGTRVIARPRRGWIRWAPQGQQRQRKERVPGRRLVGLGGWLLVLLAAGLLGVSYAAQYAYLLSERHQHIATAIEAGSLDAGMLIFSLLAVGLAMRGMDAKIERGGIMVCAAVSAVMNYAAADTTSWRSVLAFCVPPVFLAFVADRVAAAYRRHVKGLRETRSPWAVLGDATRKTAKVTGVAALYVIRVPLAPKSTFTGVRLAILAATPLPAAPVPPADAIDPPKARYVMPAGFCPEVVDTSSDGVVTQCGLILPCPVHLPKAPAPRGGSAPGHRGRGGTKTSRFLQLVEDKHGPLAAIPLDQVGPIVREQAPFVELDQGSARTALRIAIQAAADAPAEIEAPAEGDDK